MNVARLGASVLIVAVAVGLAGRVSAATSPSDPRVTPPEIIIESQIPPEFPPAALKARFSGAVTVHVEVLTDGTVGTVEVLDCSSPHVGFEEAAVNAVRRWRFEPATRDGAPVDAKIKFRLTFRGAGAGSTKGPRVTAGSFTEPGGTEAPPSPSAGADQRPPGAR